MLRKVLAVLSFGIATATVVHATSLAPGGAVTPTLIAYPTGGVLELFTGSQVPNPAAPPFSLNWSVQAYSDPSNVYCANCLDFIYQVANQGISTVNLSSFAVGMFSTSLNSVFYSNAGGFDAPTMVTRSASGSLDTFEFGTPVIPGNTTDYLIIETNAAAGPFGYTTATAESADLARTGIGLAPIPEPSSFVLLGSGLLGVAGAMKRKFLKA